MTAPGTDSVLGEKIPVWLAVLAMLPIGLVAVGGAIGGGLGALAWSINRGIATQTSWPALVRVAAMGGVTMCCVIAWVILATVLSLAIHR